MVYEAGKTFYSVILEIKFTNDFGKSAKSIMKSTTEVITG